MHFKSIIKFSMCCSLEMKNKSKLSTLIMNDLFCCVKYVKNNAEHHIMKEEGNKTPSIPLLAHDRTRERKFFFNAYILF